MLSLEFENNTRIRKRLSRIFRVIEYNLNCANNFASFAHFQWIIAIQCLFDILDLFEDTQWLLIVIDFKKEKSDALFNFDGLLINETIQGSIDFFHFIQILKCLLYFI